MRVKNVSGEILGIYLGIYTMRDSTRLNPWAAAADTRMRVVRD